METLEVCCCNFQRLKNHLFEITRRRIIIESWVIQKYSGGREFVLTWVSPFLPVVFNSDTIPCPEKFYNYFVKPVKRS